MGPAKLQTHGGDIVLGEDLLQTAAKLAVIQQQRHILTLEHGGKTGLVGGGAGTGHHQRIVALVCLKQTLDLLLHVGKHGFKLRASVANVIVHQRLTHRRFHHHGAGAEQ